MLTGYNQNSSPINSVFRVRLTLRAVGERRFRQRSSAAQAAVRTQQPSFRASGVLLIAIVLVAVVRRVGQLRV